MNTPASVQMDQMELDLKRLREDSERLSASIKQLEAQDLDGMHANPLSDDFWLAGGPSLALGGALLLVLSLLVWRLLAARKHMRPQDFVDSALYPSRQRSPRVGPHQAEKSVELRSSVWLEDPAEEDVALADEVSTPQTRQAFDFEAAASEVERVRKSLAEKRAQREQLRHAPAAPIFAPTSIAPQNSTPADVAVQENLDLASAPTKAVIVLDSELEFEFDPPPDIAVPPTEPTQADTRAIQVEEVAIAAPEVEPAPAALIEEAIKEVVDDAVAEDGRADALAVKLALAQELFALGLTAQARELAHEVVESATQDMVETARELISRCDAQALEFERQQKEYTVLLDSLRDVGLGSGG